MTPTVSFVSPYIVVALLSTFAGAALAWLVVRRNDAAIRAGDAERHASALAAARDEYERSLDDARAASERFFAEIRTQRSAAENDRDRAREQRAAALAELAAARQAEADARAQLAQTRDQFASERASLLEQVGQKIEAAASHAFKAANDSLLASSSAQGETHRTATVRGVEAITAALSKELTTLQASVALLDKSRAEGAKALETSLSGLAQNTRELRGAVDETRSSAQALATALRDNRVRGRWGEMQLRRLVELAGLVEHVDFAEQLGNEDGRRPDLVVRLPGNKSVPVDAKAPLDRYLAATEATDQVEQHRLFRESAVALRTHVRALQKRNYQGAGDGIGFTILFVPIESVMSAALAVDPALFEEGLGAGIFIATPLTLLVYLRCFAHAWSQHKQESNAVEIVSHAHELVERLAVFGEKLADIGRAVGRSVEAYNTAVGSFDGRVAVSATKIGALSGRPFELEKAPVPVTADPREVAKVATLRALQGRDQLPGIASA